MLTGWTVTTYFIKKDYLLPIVKKTRDLQDLVAKEAMIPVGAGRGARYELSMRAPKGGIWE